MGFKTGLCTFVRRWKCYNLHTGTSKWFQQQLHCTLASTSSKFKDSHITATLCNHSSPAAMDLVVPCLRYQSLSGPGWCPSQIQGVRHGSAAVLVDISASSSQKHIPTGNLQQQAKLRVSEVSAVACFKTTKGRRAGMCLLLQITTCMLCHRKVRDTSGSLCDSLMKHPQDGSLHHSTAMAIRRLRCALACHIDWCHPCQVSAGCQSRLSRAPTASFHRSSYIFTHFPQCVCAR